MRANGTDADLGRVLRDQRAIEMLIPKDEWERRVFAAFATAAGLDVDPGSVASGVPPQPDVRFTVRGVEHWVELVEITDPDLAQKHMRSLRTGAITGGSFSQRVPLEKSVSSKAHKVYATQGSPLDLVAHYDKQYPPDSVEPDLIPQTVGPIAATMVASGVWTRVWVYDGWNKRILWVYPYV